MAPYHPPQSAAGSPSPQFASSQADHEGPPGSGLPIPPLAVWALRMIHGVGVSLVGLMRVCSLCVAPELVCMGNRGGAPRMETDGRFLQYMARRPSVVVGMSATGDDTAISPRQEAQQPSRQSRFLLWRPRAKLDRCLVPLKRVSL